MQLNRTLDEKGRYLGHFDTKKEAEDFVDEQVRRYLFTPFPKETSINKICREAQDQGINLYPNTFRDELKRRGVKIRNARPQETTKVQRTFTITDYVSEQLNEYPDGMMSFMTDLGLRIIMGIPTPHVVIFLPEEEGHTTMLFRRKRKNRIQLYLSGEIDKKFEQQIRKLLVRAEKRDMRAIVEYAEQNGYQYYGGTEV